MRPGNGIREHFKSSSLNVVEVSLDLYCSGISKMTLRREILDIVTSI